MYSISGYLNMIADRVRMDAYCKALSQAIKPGATVLDIGTGTGIFAMLACKFGASRVYAVEPSEAIEVARETAAANGYSEKINFLQDLSTRLSLPERVDVIISDIRGVLPLFRQNIPSIIDARTRLLASNGQLIPRRDDLWVSVVEAPEVYQEHFTIGEDFGWSLNLVPARRYMVNTWRRTVNKREQLLTESVRWATIDYSSIENPNLRGEVAWNIERKGTAHGLAVWFDTQLSDNASFSNAPGEPELIYGQAFFPFERPITLEAGDDVSLALDAHLVGEDYVWRWETLVQHNKTKEKAHFKQSTFFSTPLAASQLRKRSSHYLPTLNENGKIDGFIFSLMNGENSLGEIARQTVERFPERFDGWQDALNHVADLSGKYS